ncbi:hypothetical protein [Streptomyces sp. NRRL WC-3549]|uniref:hypothetical protein n=1 Tax=Streptomyces sp. NRRL WC-3549 TaxID=1463925 RepID=UPI000AFBE52D
MTTPSHPAAVDAPSAGRTAAAAGRVEDRVAEALEARDALAAALTAAGVRLPAMDVRTPWQDDGSEAEVEGGAGVRPPRTPSSTSVSVLPRRAGTGCRGQEGGGPVTGGGVPAVGAVAFDERSGRVGRVTTRRDACVRLRPLGGGREWDADPALVRPAARDELLSAQLAEVNARSRNPL